MYRQAHLSLQDAVKHQDYVEITGKFQQGYYSSILQMTSTHHRAEQGLTSH